MKKINKVLIANRGEIALRIIRACKELEIKSVAVFSEVDVDGLWVKKADECYPILGDVVQAYLDYEKIISIAKKSDCDAIHPGYGFLSENADFARACEANGIIFIGPKPEHIELFGDKMASKVAMKKVGVPVLEGTDEPIIDIEEGAKIAKQIGFPVIIKAAFGGGGRGMRIVREEKDFKELFESASNEAKKYFGRGEAFIEKYVENPRHIEIQVIADKYGNVLHLGERDCSIQRRHQKLVEESPSPFVDDKLREQLGVAAVNAVKAIRYEGVGTIEFLVDKHKNFYFMEMNTRIQVEHPVTEEVTNLDLIRLQILIVAGEKIEQSVYAPSGHAIECTINAENPLDNFKPSAGKIINYIPSGGIGVRIDTHVYSGYSIPPFYDSMIAKLIVKAPNRQQAIEKMKRALAEMKIEGIHTTIPFHQKLMNNKDFVAGNFTTKFLEEHTFDYEDDV